jgi:hypothetical protein
MSRAFGCSDEGVLKKGIGNPCISNISRMVSPFVFTRGDVRRDHELFSKLREAKV